MKILEQKLLPEMARAVSLKGGQTISPVWITTDHRGKMAGMISINTASSLNEFCASREYGMEEIRPSNLDGITRKMICDFCYIAEKDPVQKAEETDADYQAKLAKIDKSDQSYRNNTHIFQGSTLSGPDTLVLPKRNHPAWEGRNNISFFSSDYPLEKLIGNDSLAMKEYEKARKNKDFVDTIVPNIQSLDRLTPRQSDPLPRGAKDAAPVTVIYGIAALGGNHVVRFHAFGEITNLMHLLSFFTIVEANPTFQFTLYTKRRKYLQPAYNGVTFPKNLTIIYSNPFLNNNPELMLQELAGLQWADKVFAVYDPVIREKNYGKMNPSARSELFKQHTGMSPEEFKQFFIDSTSKPIQHAANDETMACRLSCTRCQACYPAPAKTGNRNKLVMEVLKQEKNWLRQIPFFSQAGRPWPKADQPAESLPSVLDMPDGPLTMEEMPNGVEE